MKFDDIEDEFVANNAALSELVADHNRTRLLTVRAEAQVAKIGMGLEFQQSSLSRHLAKLRDGLATSTDEVRIVHYTCSSAAVLAVLDMLSDMFK